MSALVSHPSSFRDPSGFIFEKDGMYFRQVNHSYSQHYDMLMNSGLYVQLTSEQHLVKHEEIEFSASQQKDAYKILKPYPVKFITYPYEWCPDQLKDAALLTLKLLRTSVDYGMILKDASPFNIQFVEGKPTFIDTLSFEKYDESKPWIAYRQFCNMFLFPLYLSHYLKTDIHKILITYPEGIPVEITSRLLPLKSSFSLGVWLHVYLQNTVGNSGKNIKTDNFSKKKLLNVVTHLENIILKLNSRTVSSQWIDYYESSIIGKNYLTEKEHIIRNIIRELPVTSIIDLGCNDGHFAYIFAEHGFEVIAADSDSRSIGALYADVKNRQIKNILPLLLDVANPSPAIGFRNKERSAFHTRVKTEVVLALALVHHLAIGKNISLEALAAYFNDIATISIIEWVPRGDEKVEQMIATRPDIFINYTQENFESAFSKHFRIKNRHQIKDTQRVIYEMIKN